MRISIFGLGYVGCVSAACLANDGRKVIGVDVNPQKVETIQAGGSPIIEPGLESLLQTAVATGQLEATMDAHEAVQQSDVSLICVGTPSNSNGSLKIDFVENVCREIGAALATKEEYHVVVIRSTMLPGTVQEKLKPILEASSGKQAGTDFGLGINPEFLREGSAIYDYYHPSYIVIGELDQRSGDVIKELYTAVEAPIIRTSIDTAEMVKYVNNSFHALKVAFANEIGNLSKAQGVNGQEVMDIFCQDRQLNLSPAYLKPGFAFGGSCLPKDLRALLYRAKEYDIDCQLLQSVLPSNQAQIDRGIELIEKTGSKHIGVLGLSFKAGTDDVRESPIVPLVETLFGRGYQVNVYDENVKPDKLIGANRTFLERELPHIASLMCSSVEAVVSASDVIVVTNNSESYRQVVKLLREDQTLIDLVGLDTHNGTLRGKYEGICW